MNTTTPRLRRAAIGLAVGCLSAASFSLDASASEGHPGCNGLYEHARFTTAKNGETKGHDTVHHVFERLGCGHHGEH